jgi:cell division protein FtsI/penicillin-binding protein 2
MKEADPRAWQQTVRGRVLFAAALFAVWAIAIEARLAWLQVYRHEAMLSEATAQKDREIKVNPRRGDIVDRRGRTLAISVDAESIYADPASVEYP